MPTTQPETPTGRVAQLRAATSAKLGDQAARVVFLVTGLFVLFILGFIIWTLASEAYKLFSPSEPGHLALREFFWGTKFYPVQGGNAAWSVWPLVTATLLITFGAIIIGVPIGLGTAIYLAEYANPSVRAFLKPVLEILAGIPSIVFGFFAFLVIRPIILDWTAPGTFLHAVFGQQAEQLNALSGIIVVGVMVIPIIASISEDALRAVPGHLREASYGMGATKWETTSKVVIPAALSGITASFVLGIARAVGETMAVTLAAGSVANFTFNPLEGVRTMTAFIVQQSRSDVSTYGSFYYILFAVGFTLFLMTLALNLVARRFINKYQEVE